MKNAIIIHGMPSKEGYYSPKGQAQSNMHWLPWIQQQLIINDILTQTPEMPYPFEPEYLKWCSVFNEFHIDEHTILIGHSCGAGFLVRWLSENQRRVGKVALVAPWLDPSGNEVRSDFFQFKIDPQLAERTEDLCIFIAPEDDEEILTSAHIIQRAVASTQTVELPGRGHFTLSSMKTMEFPELRDWLLDMSS